MVLAVVILLSVSAAGYRARQSSRMKRGKEILDRYNPERSKKPLGL